MDLVTWHHWLGARPFHLSPVLDLTNALVVESEQTPVQHLKENLNSEEMRLLEQDKFVFVWLQVCARNEHPDPHALLCCVNQLRGLGPAGEHLCRRAADRVLPAASQTRQLGKLQSKKPYRQTFPWDDSLLPSHTGPFIKTETFCMTEHETALSVDCSWTKQHCLLFPRVTVMVFPFTDAHWR